MKTVRQQLNQRAMEQGYQLQEISGYCLVNASGHISLYPDLYTVDSALKAMEVRQEESEE